MARRAVISYSTPRFSKKTSTDPSEAHTTMISVTVSSSARPPIAGKIFFRFLSESSRLATVPTPKLLSPSRRYAASSAFAARCFSRYQSQYASSRGR